MRPLVCRRSKRKETGYVLITTAMISVVLLGFLGLAIDTGYLQLVKRRMETAADAAAVAGAQEVRVTSSGNAVNAGRKDAELNGFRNGDRGITVTINRPPSSGPYVSDGTAVEAIISQRAPTYFMQLLHFNGMRIRARAVSRLAGGPDCVYALDRSAPGALTVAGNGAITVNCGVVVESTSATAMQTAGNACIQASSISVVGYNSNTSSCPPNPTPITGVDPVVDPFAYLNPPAFSGCDQSNYRISGGTVTLNPGVYCGGMTISGNGTTVRLNPGTYVLNGGGMSVSGQAVFQGTGVTFYNTGTSSTYRPIAMSGGSATSLLAPTSGPYTGILFFTDRNMTSTSLNTISGGSTTRLEGALYFPTTPLSYSGGGAASGAAYTIIVAKTINFSGNSFINNDYSSIPTGNPLKGEALLAE